MHVDVHGEWVILWVTAEAVECMSSARCHSVNYVVKFYCYCSLASVSVMSPCLSTGFHMKDCITSSLDNVIPKSK